MVARIEKPPRNFESNVKQLPAEVKNKLFIKKKRLTKIKEIIFAKTHETSSVKTD